MNRRRFLKGMGLGAVAAACPRGLWGAGVAKRPANVIVVVTDDAGYVDFGCFGGKQIPTPHLDSIARAGVRCTHGYVSASVCAPSRAGLMTGRYQQRFGHEFNGPGRPEEGFTDADMGLDLREQTLGDAMKARGYRTMAIGKWHLGMGEAHHPLNRGFDEFFGMLGGARSFFPVKGNISGGGRMLRGRTVVPEEKLTYTTDDFTDEAVAFIRRNTETPFFLYLAHNAVHTPMHGKPDLIERFAEIEPKSRRTYAAMTAALDEGIGKLLATLRETKLESSTLVILINDNGGATNNASDNGPYRGMKGSKWEGGIRVAFLAQWPGRLPAGKTYDKPVISLDILPTCLAASGADPDRRKERKLDGVNLLPYLAGKKADPPHEILFWRRGVAAAVRKGPWKLIRVKGNPTLLFDLEKDRGETRDIAKDHPQVVSELLAALADWEKQLSPPKWVEGKHWETNQVLKHRLDVVGRAAERRLP